MATVKRLRHTLYISVALGITITPLPVLAGGGGLGGGLLSASLPEQIVQEGTLVQQLARQAEQVQNQLQQIAYMAQNLKTLPNSMWNQTQGELQQLTNIAAQSNSLSYAMQNVNGAFSAEYPSYQPGQNYNLEYQQWNQTTSNSITSALQQQGLQASNFATEQDALAQISAASQSAVGRMQVLQAGNQIAAMQVDQLQKLRQITMANSDAQLAYLKQQQATAATDTALSQQAYSHWTSGSGVPTSGYDSFGQFSNP